MAIHEPRRAPNGAIVPKSGSVRATGSVSPAGSAGGVRAHERAAPGGERRIGGLVVRSTADLSKESISIAIAAKFGTGKTSLWGTALDWPGIKIRKAFCLDTEGGLRPVRHYGDAIDFVPVFDWDSGLKVIADLERGAAEDYGVLVLDNSTEFADQAMEDTLKDQGKEEPDWEAWRFNSRKFVVRAVRKLRDIGRKYGIPVIFTVWDREETNDQGNVKAVHADFNPALRKLVLGAVDFVGWEEVAHDDVSRILHITATKRLDAKIRLDRNLAGDRSVPPYLYNPSLVPILDTMMLGKPWPDPNPYALPDGLIPRFSRAPRVETRKEVKPPRPAPAPAK